MTLAQWLAALVVVLAIPLNWYVTVRLWQLARIRPKVRVLHERAVVALSLAVIVTVFGLVFVNNELPDPPLDGDATRIVTRIATLVWSLVPALFWLKLYRDTKP